MIDGASVLPRWWYGFILAAVNLVSPVVNTRLAATALRLIGWGDLGVALRSASPAAFRRSWMEGYTAADLRGRARSRLPDPARRGRAGTCPSIERRACRAPAARDRPLRASAQPRLVRVAARAAPSDGRGMAHRTGASGQAQARAGVARGRGRSPSPNRQRRERCEQSAWLRNCADNRRPISTSSSARRSPRSPRSCPDGYPQTSVVWCDFDGEYVRRQHDARLRQGAEHAPRPTGDPPLLRPAPPAALSRGPRHGRRDDRGRGRRHLDELASKYAGGRSATSATAFRRASPRPRSPSLPDPADARRRPRCRRARATAR